MSADRYELGITRLGRRAIAEGLPEDVAAAVLWGAFDYRKEVIAEQPG